jgi:hypothetical protein
MKEKGSKKMRIKGDEQDDDQQREETERKESNSRLQWYSAVLAF